MAHSKGRWREEKSIRRVQSSRCQNEKNVQMTAPIGSTKEEKLDGEHKKWPEDRSDQAPPMPRKASHSQKEFP
jgi:hypothetical protein